MANIENTYENRPYSPTNPRKDRPSGINCIVKGHSLINGNEITMMVPIEFSYNPEHQACTRKLEAKGFYNN
ncbi:hypothetical protein HQ545_00555 [Candidatus Woesearchaeota archaeon]|nr:hypothetical protein [Candidatus Woesearchaeota archaeon]